MIWIIIFNYHVLCQCFLKCDPLPPDNQWVVSVWELVKNTDSQSPSKTCFSSVHLSSVQSLSHVQLFATPWIAARQATVLITISRSSLSLTSIEFVMPSSHPILSRPLLFLPPVPPSIRVFSSESTLLMRWPKYWSFSFSIILETLGRVPQICVYQPSR